MRLKYLVLICAIGAASYYVYQDKALRTKLLGKVHQVAPELNQSTLYRWQNSKGEWQITDTPPAKGIAFTTVKTQDQINVMPSPTTEKKK